MNCTPCKVCYCCMKTNETNNTNHKKSNYWPSTVVNYPFNIDLIPKVIRKVTKCSETSTYQDQNLKSICGNDSGNSKTIITTTTTTHKTSTNPIVIKQTSSSTALNPIKIRQFQSINTCNTNSTFTTTSTSVSSNNNNNNNNNQDQSFETGNRLIFILLVFKIMYSIHLQKKKSFQYQANY
jgi:hypothetical protein